MNKKPNIFVIIVTYKGERWYDKCFSSLRESTIPVQAVVVDNSPSVEDVNYIKEHFPEVHVIKTEENLGFGRANNLGMRYALDKGCDYVFLLNQDAWIESDTIDKLVKVAAEYEEYGVISPIHLNADHTAINMTLGIGDHYRNNQLLSDLYVNKLQDIYATNYANAAAWLLPRKTLETIGGFCPIIFQYGEDDDYAHRVLYHGYKIGVVPSARIVHDSKNKLELSKKLYDRAQWDDIDGFLDINQTKSLSSIRRYLFRKRIVCFLHGQKGRYQFYTYRYKFLCEHQKEIERCMAAHRIKQANWL